MTKNGMKVKQNYNYQPLILTGINNRGNENWACLPHGSILDNGKTVFEGLSGWYIK